MVETWKDREVVALICDGVRTPIGRYGGSLSGVRADDLAAVPIAALVRRNPRLRTDDIDDVIMGAANQAGEDNRNVARMAALLAGLPETVPGITVNRLCASGLDAVGIASRGIRAGDQDIVIAGGIESMSRAPFVLQKSATPFSRSVDFHDTTIGWRFVNPAFRSRFGTDSMPETADNVADEYGVKREDQDAFALRSQARWSAAEQAGHFTAEIVPVEVLAPGGGRRTFSKDEHPRPGTSLEKLSNLNGINGTDRSVTAGNASGINDGAAALLVASEQSVLALDIEPMARILGTCSAGVAPRVMGIGPVPATRRLLKRTGLTIDQMDIVEINEAFAAQALAVLRELGIEDDDERVNPNGGAIAMGHPLGMSGARLILSAANSLRRSGGRFALCTMCVGVGQGSAMILERA